MHRSEPLWVVAGEPSGDGHLAHVVRELKARRPDLQFRGYGGRELALAGVTVIEDLAQDAIMGLFPVVKALPKIRGWFRRALEDFDRNPPQALLLCDYPGFNLRLAAAAKQRGIPVIYYIGPQLWAWAPWRIKKVKRVVDHMIVILPFEEAIYQKAGVPVSYVGHPLMDHLSRAQVDPARVQALKALGEPLIGLFPGSRPHVVQKLAPLFLKAAEALSKREGFEKVHFICALAQGRFQSEIAAIAPKDLALSYAIAEPYAVMRAMDAAIATSGTTTLELAASDRPFVLGYRVSRFFFALGRRLIAVPFIGLVNLVAGRSIVPEHVGHHDFHLDLARDLEALLREESVRARQLEGFAEVRAKLSQGDSYERTADAILAALQRFTAPEKKPA